MLPGGGSVTPRFGENVQLSVKARYNDSDLTYFTHYTDSYSNPTNPYLDAVGHQLGLYSDGSFARLNVFSTDNNLQFKFSTGPAIHHTVLLGLDYRWNNVRNSGGFGYQDVELYGLNSDALTNIGKAS